MTVYFGSRNFGTASIDTGDSDPIGPSSMNSNPSDWAQYAPPPPPPMVAADVNQGGQSSGGFLSSLTSIFGSVSAATQAVAVNIRGQPVYAPPQPGQAGYVAPTPIWVYLLIPVGAIALLVVVKKSRSSAAVAGYRRRKSRRSRR